MMVVIAAEAESDLHDIAIFIAIDNPARAASFVQDLVSQCNFLADQPLRHPIATDYGQRLRRFPYRGYSIYYQVLETNQVVIVHILNDAMDHRPYFEN